MYYRYFSRIVIAVCFLTAFAAAQLPARDPNIEGPVVESLRKITDDDTASKFVAATDAMDKRDYETAIGLYEEVLKKVPNFDGALRRLGYVYIAVGRRPEGLDLTGKALAQERSVPNLVGRAASLVSSDKPDYQPSYADRTEAMSLSREAWEKSGKTDEDAASLLAETLLMSTKHAEFKDLARAFRRAKPESARAAYYYAMVLADEGELNAAEAELGRSRKLGAPEEMVSPLAMAIAEGRDSEYLGLGRFRSLVYPVIGLVLAWALGLAALFLIGRHLSQKTMRAIETSDPNDITGEAQSSLKKIYRRVVSIAGIYYYVSQPFVIFLVVFFTAAVVLFFLWIGRIPIGFILGVLFVGAASIFYMVKSLITRAKIDDPGRPLTEAEAPELWHLVRNVAEIVKTRPVNEIRITPGTDLAVYERGSFRQKMSDQADRILILGIAVLNDFDQNAFRAVLAHEYGHFSNRDTAGGDIAYRVNTDIVRIAESMVASQTNTYYNIGFHFLRLFYFLFRRITHGASRLQEVLADRVAAYHFGPDSFRAGLSHVIRRQFEFVHVADKEINAALGSNRAFANIYEMSVGEDSERRKIEEEIEKAFNEETTEDDTHPSPRDRFRYIEGARGSGMEPLPGNVWDLFTNRESLTTEMNSLIERLVRPT